ncbi:MAG: ribosomal-processing cysteine protease Prp [Brevinema sp.]
MIRVILAETTNCYQVEILGHSGKQGSSIVCAGVSALVESWRLAEQVLEGVECDIAAGAVKGFIPKTDTSRVLFLQLTLGLRALAAQYPNEIEINTGGQHGI